MWKEEIERDFMQLKETFTKGGIQAFPDFGIENLFIFTTDWSQENIPGVLSKVQNGEERFLDDGEESVISMREIILVTKENCWQ